MGDSSWFFLREDKCCSKGCGRQRLFDDLCGLCFAGSNPPERATALLFDSLAAYESPPFSHGFQGFKSIEEVALPSYLQPIVQLLEALVDGIPY